MSWTQEIVTIVRYMVGDSESVVYTDNQIQKNILIAAQIVKNEVNFPKAYFIDVFGGTITPDPTEEEKDQWFVSLVSLKTACMILTQEARIYGIQSIKIVDGPSTIDTSQRAKNLMELSKERCKDYEKHKMQFAFGDSAGGFVISTPTTIEYLNPRVFN
jgi:hypothetical protein